MKKCLVMLTSGFPYGFSETYIESEITFLKNRFDKIIILPIELNPEEKPTRDVPDGVEFYNVSVKKQKTARLSDTVGGLKKLIFPTEYYAYDRDEIGSSFSKRMFFEYFCNRSARSYKDCLRVLEKCNMREYDSITVYSYWLFATAFVGVMLKDYFSEFCDDVKLISRAHGYDVYEERNALNYLPLRKILLDKCDVVYPCSDSGTQHIAGRYPEYAKKIKTAHLGTPDCGLSEESENGLHIVSCSQIADIKRIDKIIDILEKFNDNDKYNIRWTHIGDGNRRAEIEQTAKNKLRSVKTEFLGSITNKEVYEYYKENPVDLFISTSKSEGLPVSMMEAASFGIPIFSTDVGGVCEIVKSGYNGQLFDADASADEFAERIRKFYDMSESEKLAYRKNSRNCWKENFNAEKVYSDFFQTPVTAHS